jgi:hypothetical protein
LPCYLKLVGDETDNVRQSAVSCCVELAKILVGDDAFSSIIASFSAFSEDRYTRVRSDKAKFFGEVFS